MDQGTLSFWADISKYEEALAKDPNSFCFAPLADVYRKLGLLDEAIAVAKRGCERHPGYIGGFMALGRAYFEKGMKEESRASLEKVIDATPENHLAQKLLIQLYLDAGDYASAKRSLQVILATNPDDEESRQLLNSLSSDRGSSDQADSTVSEDGFHFETDVVQGTALEYELALDEVEVIEELTEIIDHAEPVGDRLESALNTDVGNSDKDPLKTATLAELYVSQGFLSSALAIYQDLLKNDPANEEYRIRSAEITKALGNGEKEDFAEDAPADVEEMPAASFFQPPSEAVPNGSDPVILLERWLENIQRRR